MTRRTPMQIRQEHGRERTATSAVQREPHIGYINVTYVQLNGFTTKENGERCLKCKDTLDVYSWKVEEIDFRPTEEDTEIPLCINCYIFRATTRWGNEKWAVFVPTEAVLNTDTDTDTDTDTETTGQETTIETILASIRRDRAFDDRNREIWQEEDE